MCVLSTKNKYNGVHGAWSMEHDGKKNIVWYPGTFETTTVQVHVVLYCCIGTYDLSSTILENTIEYKKVYVCVAHSVHD